MKDRDGSVVITLLFILALLSLAALTTLLNTRAAIRLVSSSVHGTTAQEEAFKEALGALTDTAPAKGLICAEGEAKHGREIAKRSICAAYLPAGEALKKGLVPLIDFGQLLNQADSCRAADYPGRGYATAGGMRLTNSAVVSTKSCIHKTIAITQNTAVGGNFSAAVATISKGTLPTSPYLAAAGYIEIEELKVSAGAAIIAGGDIHIKTLRIPDELDNAAVTLISATGVVLVQASSPRARLGAAGRAGVYLPTDAELVLPKVPATLNLQILGIQHPSAPSSRVLKNSS